MARRYNARLEQAPIQPLVTWVPIISVMLASLLPVFIPVIASYPVIPPFGLIILIAWRFLVRDIWPAWIGLPLGFFDDLLSGQPIGSAACIWTVVLLIMEVVDRRMMWRDYKQDWRIGAALIAFAISAGLFLSNITGGAAPFWLVIPQMFFSALLLPVALRLCLRLDRFRWRI
jgi:rod shape-determining protein MreD